MKDHLWHEVDLNIRPLLRGDDVVLAPHGDWPPFPCAARYYDDWIEPDDATVLILYKGHLTGMFKRELAHIAEYWQCIFANAVMVVFSRAPRLARDYRRGPGKLHYQRLHYYLHSASYRRRKNKICYVHVPKAGGTSMWGALNAQFPAHVYYGSIEACLRNPPDPDDYDLIGVHFSPAVIAPYLSADDRIVGMVREPVTRFLSGVLHSRRESEDTQTFSHSMMQMRERPLSEFLETDEGRYESRLQLILFGTDYQRSFQQYSEEEMLARAMAFARRDDVMLAPCEQSERFAEVLVRELSLRPLAPGRLNVNDRANARLSPEEIARAETLLKTRTHREKEWYDFVCHRFDERFPDMPHGRRRRLFSLFRSRPASDRDHAGAGSGG